MEYITKSKRASRPIFETLSVIWLLHVYLLMNDDTKEVEKDRCGDRSTVISSSDNADDLQEQKVQAKIFGSIVRCAGIHSLIENENEPIETDVRFESRSETVATANSSFIHQTVSEDVASSVDELHQTPGSVPGDASLPPLTASAASPPATTPVTTHEDHQVLQSQNESDTASPCTSTSIEQSISDSGRQPGAEAIPGPGLPTANISESSPTAGQMFHTVARLVDEDLERARIEEEIISSSPVVEAVDEISLRRRRKRLQLGYALLCTVAIAIVATGLTLGLRSTQSMPYNDTCLNAKHIEKLPFSFSGDTESAGLVEASALGCGTVDSNDRGVWFQIMGSASPGTCLRAAAHGINFDALLTAHVGSCDDLVCFGSGWDGGQIPFQIGTPKSVVVLPSGRTSYYLLVSGSQGLTGQFRLEISEYDCLANDQCATPKPVDSLPFADSGLTVLATAEDSTALQCPTVSSEAKGVYYEIAGFHGTCLTASTIGSDFETVLAVYEGVDCDELSCVGSGRSDGHKSKITWIPTPEAVYKILVAGKSQSVGMYNFSIKENECDRCVNAVDVNELPHSSTGGTGVASLVESIAIQEQCPSIKTGDRGVWYSVTSKSGHCITASTKGSDFEFDTVLALYEGSCENLTCIGQNDNWKECSSCRTSHITWNPHSRGMNYKLLIIGGSGSVGNFSMNIEEEQCDKCPNAILVRKLPFHDSGSTEFADPVGWLGNECRVVEREKTRGVWYRLDNLGTGRCITASTSGSQMNTLLAVYEAQDHMYGCDSLKCINSNNDIPPGTDDSEKTRSEIFWRGVPGKLTSPVAPKDYYVLVGGHDGSTGHYELSVTEYDCLQNDDCGDAIFVDTLPYKYSGTTLGATAESEDLQRCSWVTETTRGVFHEVFGIGSCIAATLESDYYDSIAIYEGKCGNLNCVVQSQANLPVQKHVAWNSRNGTLYKVYVAGFEDIVGNYNLTINGCIEKDECVAPAKVSELPFRDSDIISEDATSTYWQTRRCPVFNEANTYGNGFWYEVVGTGSCIALSTAGSTIDTVVGIFEGDCDELSCIASNDDALTSLSSYTTWKSAKDLVYKVLVGGYGGEIGPYNISIEEIPCVLNDDCANASTIDEVPFAVSGDTLAATTESFAAAACIEEYHFTFSGQDKLFDSRGVWYELKGESESCFEASAADSSFESILAVFEGDCESLSCVVTGQHRVRWNTSGYQTSYKILLAGQDGQFGPFKFNITMC